MLRSLLASSGSDFGGLGVVPWPNEALTYLQALMELSGTLEGSLQIKKILEYPTQFYVQSYVQEYARDS